MRLTWREDWLTEARLSLYPKIIFIVYVVLAVGWVAVSGDMVDPSGKPLGLSDFIAFWAASHFALGGHAIDAYDAAKMFTVVQMAAPGNKVTFLWNYPPVFHLAVLPLALLPYFWAYGAWVVSTLTLYAVSLRKLVPSPHALWLVLAFPATLINVTHGQNGFLTAVLVAVACFNLERRPVLAGILIGALCYKPQFGLLFPFILLAGRHWVPFAAAGVSTLAICGLATLVFGVEHWAAFWNGLPVAEHALETGLLPWHKMPTVFVAMRMAGAAISLAYTAHFLVAAVVAALTVHAWYRQKGTLELRAALLSIALLLMSPYAFDYDLVVLALPILVLIADGQRNGWMPGLRTVLLMTWLTPSLTFVALKLSLQLMPALLLVFFAFAYRRIAGGSRVALAPAPA